MTIAEQFADLAQRVSVDAAHIECSPEEYRSGLHDIIEILWVDIRASEDTDPHDDPDDN